MWRTINYINAHGHHYENVQPNYSPHVKFVPLQVKNHVQTGSCPNWNKTLSPSHSGMYRLHCIRICQYMYVLYVEIQYATAEKDIVTLVKSQLLLMLDNFVKPIFIWIIFLFFNVFFSFVKKINRWIWLLNLHEHLLLYSLVISRLNTFVGKFLQMGSTYFCTCLPLNLPLVKFETMQIEALHQEASFCNLYLPPPPPDHPK